MKKKTTDDIGVFNILLIGKCSGAISIADNIHAKFKEEDGSVKNPCNFNIIGDIDSNIECSTWFNEFIFEFIKGVHVNFLTKVASPTVLIKALAEVKPSGKVMLLMVSGATPRLAISNCLVVSSEIVP